MNAIAGIATTLLKAAQPEFKTYARQVLKNAQGLAAALSARGCTLVTGGTENHLMVINTVASFGIDGKVAETVLDETGLTVNKQVIPDDPGTPVRPSGIRLGTPAITTRGLSESHMGSLAGWIVSALRSHRDASTLGAIRADVANLCSMFPVPGL